MTELTFDSIENVNGGVIPVLAAAIYGFLGEVLVEMALEIKCK